MPHYNITIFATFYGLYWLDWVTLTAYAAMMLGVGWYFAVRTRSVDDYILGGRTMNPWSVGLSMFVTYMSILTYLAYPGEMVRHGPIFLSQLFAFPVIFFIGAVWIIPFAMRKQVVSAYELLEERFGTGMRLYASSLFIIQRFIWMGVIIYAVVDVILVPIFDVPREWLPYICIGIGLFTALYSTMGGIKAVVVTDVIQACILLGGALVTIGYLVWLNGGVTWLWPDHWYTHWPDKNIWFGGVHTRISVFDMILAVLVWNVATAGSDQMAIQRYLAMGSVSKARKMYGISLGTDGLVVLLIGIIGLGLLAYYMAHVDMLPGNGYIDGPNADKLFPLFILEQLPMGLSGLLIAAVLAAAMSSLSSGINSSSSVILVDFVERLFGHHAVDPQRRVRYARIISMGIGLVVVGLSILVANAQGNLMEICSRIVNLLTGPLFVMFFLAIFVPWASKLGVWVGAIVSLFIALFIAFPWAFGMPSLKIGFNWIIICSLVGGILTGSVTIPFRRSQ